MILRFLIALILFAVAMAATAFEAFSLAVLTGAAAFLIAAVFPLGTIRSRAISLESVAVGALAAYSLAVPIHYVFYRDYPREVIAHAFLLSLLAAASFSAGTFLHRVRVQHVVLAPRAAEWDWLKYYHIGWIIFWFGIASAVLAVGLTVGFDAYMNAGYAGRALLKRQAGPIELGLYHAVLGLAFVNLARLRSPRLQSRQWLRYLVIAISIVFVVYVSFLGIRRPSFFLVLTMVMLYGIAGQGYGRIGLAVTVIPVIVLFALFANFRQILTDQGTTAAVEFVSTNFSFAWFDLSKTELGAPFRVLIDVLTTWTGDPLRLGLTYAATIPYVFPRIAGLSVTSLSQEYTSRNFAESFYAIGGNMGFHPIAEGYINYGSLGVAAYFLLIGYFVSHIQWRASTRSSPIDLVAFAVAAPWFIFFLRTDLASFSKVFVYSVGVPYVLALGLLIIWRRARRHA